MCPNRRAPNGQSCPNHVPTLSLWAKISNSVYHLSNKENFLRLHLQAFVVQFEYTMLILVLPFKVRGLRRTPHDPEQRTVSEYSEQLHALFILEQMCIHLTWQKLHEIYPHSDIEGVCLVLPCQPF